MKKLFAIFLAVMMIMTLAVPVFAEGETGTGSITVNKASINETYSIYKMLNLESYDSESGSYYYTINSDWSTFFSTGAGNEYIVVDEDYGYVKWVEGKNPADLAAAAMKWVTDNSISATTSKKADSNTVVFSNLDLGYYLIDSSLGAICGLRTTAPDAVINEKNGLPSISKQVQEDSNLNWGISNDADMFQIINFKTTVTVDGSGVKYVVHDTMDAALSYIGVTGVKLRKSGETDETDVAAAYYTVEVNPEDNCTFDVKLHDALLATLEDYDEIIIYYTAQLNENAKEDTPYVNITWLTFGDASKTQESSTTTKTYSFDLVKTDGDSKVLGGAIFKLYNAKVDGTEIGLVMVSEGVYRIAKSDENAVDIVVPESGVVKVYGVDGGTTYYLEETVAPTGYNKLASREAVVIETSNLTATIEQGVYTEGGVQIVNQTGTVLPETGGFGTTLFIVLGGLTVLVAGVLLFVKKRMEQVAE